VILFSAPCTSLPSSSPCCPCLSPLQTFKTVNLFSWNWIWTFTVAVILKFPTFYGTQRFITMFTTARHWTLPWVKWIQSIPYQPISRLILILSSHLRLGFTVISSLQIVQKQIWTHELIPVTSYHYRIHLHRKDVILTHQNAMCKAGSLVYLDENQHNATLWSSKSHLV
jgi:hypothetical protein